LERIRITIADDHPVVLAGLGMLLETESGFDVVGKASTGPEAVTAILSGKPQVAIIDIALPEMDGIAVARQVGERDASIGIVMLTQHDEPGYLKQSLNAGARGFVLKSSTANCLIAAVHGVHVGGLYVDPAIAGQLFSSRNQKIVTSGSLRIALTEREATVIREVASGRTSRDIARSQGLSPSTIETHKSRAMDKLGIHSRSDIVRFAQSQGWL
jgi:DNA-binding NarL/FixJ family response regulator